MALTINIWIRIFTVFKMINDKESEEVLLQESGEGTGSGLSPKLKMFIEVIVGSKKKTIIPYLYQKSSTILVSNIC